MGFRKLLGVSLVGTGALLASMVITASPSMAASCSTSHTTTSATGHCSGYTSTGTFRISATFCSFADGCITKKGPYVFLAGGTSSAYAPSGMHWSSNYIEMGPPGGIAAK